MMGFIMVFIITYIIGFIIGFINEMTNGGIKWLMIFGVVAFFIWLVSTFGFGLGTLFFFVIVALVIRGILRFVKGAITGLLSFFTHGW